MKWCPARSPVELTGRYIMNANALDQFIITSKTSAIQSRLVAEFQKPSQDYLLVLRRNMHELIDPTKLFFDEEYYLMCNKDVLDELFVKGVRSGLHHFLGWGIHEGRAPLRFARLAEVSAGLLAGDLRDGSGATLDFDALCDLFRCVEPETLAKCYLRAEVRLQPQAPRLGDRTGEFRNRPWLHRVMDEFDRSFYEQAAGRSFADKRAAFLHYLETSRLRPVDPCASFDEAFYRAFHYDVAAAIQRGELLCGFEHYIVSGRAENRVARFDAVATLEAVLPGVTRPRALDNIDSIESKIVPCAHRVDPSRPPTVWILAPFFYADIMFGGFASFIEFIEQLIARSVRIGLFIKDAPRATLGYFKFRSPGRALTERLDSVETYSPIDCAEAFAFGPEDIFICYSNWDGLWGRQFAQKTRLGLPVYWIQEHEAIFFSHDCRRFLMDSVYEHDHVGIFNSEFLRQYFTRQKIGRYRDPDFAERRAISYQHVLQFIEPKRRLRRPREHKRRFLVYARPEDHAARNLFEIAVVGLRLALRRGVFDEDWEFKGVGSLGGPYEVDLGEGRTLQIAPKMPLEDYRAFIQDVDIGVALMYAPHPSLLPYEMALTGAVVITNDFEQRGPEFFSRYEGNILSFQPTVEDYVDTIAQAVARVTAPGYVKHIPAHRQGDWADVFSDAFFRKLERLGLSFAACQR
jgi:hypothetical protein